MRKLLHVAIAGLAAVSFSALAADNTEVDANTKIQGDTKAGTAGAGASTEINKADKKKGKAKQKRGTSGAGGTQAPMTKDEPKASGGSKTEPAPAPTPAPVEAQKKID